MQRGIFRKLSFEDRFDRKYACWVKNNPKAWSDDKRRNRRESRRKLKKELEAELGRI